MSETVERKPNNKKRLLGAILLALGALLLVGQIVGAIAGAVVYRAAQRRSEQPVVVVEEIAVQAERDAQAAARDAEIAAQQAQREAELSAREAERVAQLAERDAEAAAREAELAAAQMERQAERMAEQAERNAERMAAQFERDFGGAVYTVEVERRTPFFFSPFRTNRGPGLIPLALILFGVYLVIKQRRAAAAPVPQTGPEADHGPAV
jgi:flagellar biosynthesis GTPase FlhF